MPVDDAELSRRLAELEAEVKAAQPKPKAAPPPKARPAARPVVEEEVEDDDDAPSKVDTALMVAKGAKLANRAQKELTRPRKQGDKSWLASAGLSLLFGPIGWLYAGSFREAIPGAFLYILVAGLLSKLPMFLVWPVMMVGLPLSAIAGLVYALQYNKHGKRMRLWDKTGKQDKKQLPPRT